MLPTDESFAPAIVNEVKKSVTDQLNGQPGWRVVTVNQNGVDVDVLNEVAGDPAPSITISLDRAVQNAAQNAVNTTGKKAMIVAIKPSTGEILAVAQNAAADADGPLATIGSVPAGFDVQDRSPPARPSSATWQRPTRCWGAPARWTSGTGPVPNYDAFDLGTVPMSRAFANSCNTTFAELASRMPPRGLDPGRRAVRHRHRTTRWTGIPTVTGSVPPTVDLAERTEDGFGQGKVLVSPFGMALAAATVAAGKTPVPQLIEGRQTTRSTGDRAP